MRYLFLRLSLWLLLLNSFPVTSILAQEAEKMSDRLVVTNVNGKGLAASRAKTLEFQELVVIYIDEADKRSAFQKDFYIGSVPLFPEDASGLKFEEIEEVLQEYQALSDKLPGVAELIQVERAKWESLAAQMRERRQAELAQKQKELEEKLTKFLALQYVPTEKYPKDLLLSVAEQGKELLAGLPDRQAEISQALEPWVLHAQYVGQGKVYVDGQWLTAEEIRKAREAEIQQAIDSFLESGIDLKMNGLVVPQMSVLIAIGFVIVTLIMVLYMFMALASSRGGALTVMGGITLLLGLGILGMYGYGAYKIMTGPNQINQYVDLHEAVDNADLTRIKRALFIASKPKDYDLTATDTELVAHDVEINRLVRDHVRFELTEESKFFDLERNGFACVFLADRVVLLDQVSIFGKSMLLRYELFHKIANDTISFNKVDIYLSNLKLPGRLVSYFWSKMSRDLRSVLKQTGLTDIYEISNVEEKRITLLLTSQPEKAADLEDEAATEALTEGVDPVATETLSEANEPVE